ncbi:PREDICTED: centromere protein C, partial [Mesitornis unicolor]|uniref:centromere protein C n=1 Tax=Mesitornis unicolor TaxID=54374 RepID=UPI000528E962
SLFKKEYRARFCRGEGNKIEVQPGQNVLKIIQDCFESCSADLTTVSSPNASCFSTPVVRNEKRTSIQSQRPNAGLTNSVKRVSNSVESSAASSSSTTVSSRGWSPESPLKPATHDHVADSKPTESPVSKRKTDISKDVEALHNSPAKPLDSEDDHESFGSPILVEEVKSSPEHVLHFDDQNASAAVKSHVQVQNLEEHRSVRDEQVVAQGTGHSAASSVRKGNLSFSSLALAAVTTGIPGKRYSAVISPPLPPPVKNQDIEVESECEFLIDESDDVSVHSWFSIPRKNKKSIKGGSATSVLKSQPSEKVKTGSKKGKNRKVEVEALSKQKMRDLDVQVQDSKRTSESDMVSSNTEGKVLKSPRQSSTRKGITRKDALVQGSSHQKKGKFWKPKAAELLLSPSGLKRKAPDAEHRETKEMPSKDSPVPSAKHQQERTVSPKKNLKSSKYLQSASKAAQHLVPKKKPAKQKLSKDTAASAKSPRKKLRKSSKESNDKKPQLQSREGSDSEPGEEGLEGEPVQLSEVFTSPQRRKSQTSVDQKLDKSEKLKNVLQAVESLASANNITPVKALQNLIDSVKNSAKKRSLPETSGSITKTLHRRPSKRISSSTEDVSDAQNAMDSDSSSVRHVAKPPQKLSDVKIKKKRKRNMQQGLQ